MTESTDSQHPDCMCDHPRVDHQQSAVDLAIRCNLCGCPAYAPVSDCMCDHPHADHQQPVDLGGECDLCDCPRYIPLLHFVPAAPFGEWRLADAATEASEEGGRDE